MSNYYTNPARLTPRHPIMYGRNQHHEMSSHERALNCHRSPLFRGSNDDEEEYYLSDDNLDGMTLVGDESDGSTDHDITDRRTERLRPRPRPRTDHRRPTGSQITIPHHDRHYYDRRPRPNTGFQAGTISETETPDDDPFSLQAQTARSRTATGRRNAIAVPSGVAIPSGIPERTNIPHHQRQGRQRQRESTPLWGSSSGNRGLFLPGDEIYRRDRVLDDDELLDLQDVDEGRRR